MPKSAKSGWLNFRVTVAKRMIHADYSSPHLGLAVISQRLGLSKSYLCRIFKREAGMGLPDYISAVRAQAAGKLLRETPLTVKEIAAAVGFTYVTQLDRAFKTAFRSTPKEWRARILISDAQK